MSDPRNSDPFKTDSGRITSEFEANRAMAASIEKASDLAEARREIAEMKSDLTEAHYQLGLKHGLRKAANAVRFRDLGFLAEI